MLLVQHKYTWALTQELALSIHSAITAACTCTCTMMLTHNYLGVSAYWEYNMIQCTT